MKIAILTHFGSFQPGYALHVGWLERARMLDRFEVDFDFLVNDTCDKLDKEYLYPHARRILRRPPKNIPFAQQVDFYRDEYVRILQPYDVILTADLIYQRTFLPQNAAMRAAEPHLRAHWCHWVHSSWINRPHASQMTYPNSLRFTPMANSTLVYMNETEKAGLAKMFGVDPDNVACVYNPKDYRSFHSLDPLTWKIIDTIGIPNKDVVQIFPHCSTRMDAKGIDAVIRVHAGLKRAGARVAIIFANANGRHRLLEIADKKRFCERNGLHEGEDFIFTGDLTPNAAPLPRRNVAELFRLSNLFVFASQREVSPNCLLEAKVSGNLLVLSNRLPCLKEFGGSGPKVIYFDATSKTPGVPDGQQGDLQLVTYHNERGYFDHLAQQILERLPSVDIHSQWEFSYERIWYGQMKPLLEMAAAKAKVDWNGKIIDQRDNQEEERKPSCACNIIVPQGTIETAGLMAISDFPLAPKLVQSLAMKCDLVALRFDAINGDKDIWEQCKDAVSRTDATLISFESNTPWNRWNWRQELVERLEPYRPKYVLFLDSDEEYGPGFDDDFAIFKASNAQIMMFDYEMVVNDNRYVDKYPKARHMKAFKWVHGVNYNAPQYRGYALANFPGVYPEPGYNTNRFLARSLIQHYCFYNQDIENVKVSNLHR